MPLFEDLQARFASDSAKVSASIRTLAFSAIAALWLVTHPATAEHISNVKHPLVFKWAIILFVLAIAVDVLHPLVTSLFYYEFLEDIREPYKEGEGEGDLWTKDHELSKKVLLTPWIFYLVKSSLLVAGGSLFIFQLFSYRF